MNAYARLTLSALGLLILLISSFNSFVFPVTAEKAIPLLRAIEQGIRTDAQFQNHQVDAEMTRLNQQKARIRKRFQLDFSGSYWFQSEQMEISLPVTVPELMITAGSKHNVDLNLSMVQPLFTGNILSNSLKLESQRETRANYNILLRSVQVAGMVKSSYFTYRLLESKKRSLSLLEKTLSLHFKTISHFYDEDLVKKSDLLETRIKLTETGMKLEELNQLMVEEEIHFSSLCGFAVQDIEDGYRETIGSAEQSLSFFKTHHPLLKGIDQEIGMMGLKKKIASGRYLPQVSGFAQIHYAKPGIDFFKNQWSLYFKGGVGVGLKVFDWLQLKRDKQLLDMAVEKLNNRRAGAIVEVKKKLSQLYAHKQSIETQLELTGRLVAFATEDAALKEELYRERQMSNVDLLAALLTKERFQSMQQELRLQGELINLGINTLIGRKMRDVNEEDKK